MLAREQSRRRAIDRHHPPHFGASRARQDQQRPVLPGFAAAWRERANMLDERMTDIIARRAAKPRQSLRLERQNGENMIDIGPHRRRPPGPPGPHRRAHIVDDRKPRRASAHTTRDAMRKIRRVDQYEAVGRAGQYRPDRFIQARYQTRQSGKHRNKPHHREIRQRKQARQPFARHLPAAHAGDDDARLRRTQRAHQQRAKMIPGGFARDNKYPRHDARPARGAHSGRLDGARKNSTMTAMSASSPSSLASVSTRIASGGGSVCASRANSRR